MQIIALQLGLAVRNRTSRKAIGWEAAFGVGCVETQYCEGVEVGKGRRLGVVAEVGWTWTRCWEGVWEVS